jgi:phospholipid/cholesterol/gamma-HCH transport system substrate-binding protein
MKIKPAQKIKIGVFTLAGLLLLCLAIFMIGSSKNIFRKTVTIYGDFKNVGGLLEGNLVRLNGVNAGSVKRVYVINDTTVRVEMNIIKDMSPFLKNDATASIGTDGLMGDKVVIISPGGNSPVRLANGDRIRTINPIDFEKTMARLNRVTENVEVISGSLASISTQISSGKGTIGKLIYDDSLQQGLVQTVNSARQTMQEARRTVNAVTQTVNSAKLTVKSVNGTLAKADQTVETAQQGVEGFKENMEALKHNILFKGYYKKKAREANSKTEDSLRVIREQEKKEKKEQRRAMRRERKASRKGHHDPEPKEGIASD